MSDALIHESTKLLIPKSMLSPKVRRIKGDTSNDYNYGKMNNIARKGVRT